MSETDCIDTDALERAESLAQHACDEIAALEARVLELEALIKLQEGSSKV